MRRMVKEDLLKFDGTPLFPERIAYTVPYKLSEAEAHLYKAVTDYVREEFNRAEALQNDKRAGTVGFALTILQRRLASSPEAIYQSLRRRRERLDGRARELEVLQRGGHGRGDPGASVPALDAEDVEDLDEAPDDEVEAAEAEILDQATAARIPRRAEDRDRDPQGPGVARPRRPPRRHRHQVARAGQPPRRHLHRRRRRWAPGPAAGPRGFGPGAPADALAPPEARPLHRAPRHAQLPPVPDHDPARPRARPSS